MVIHSDALRHESVPQASTSSTQSAREVHGDDEPVLHAPLATADACVTRKTKARASQKKVGRRADKVFAAAQTTRKGSKKKTTGKSMMIGTAPPLRWINTGTDNTTTPEMVVTYLTTLAAHRAANDSEFLLGTVRALLREGERQLAFMDDSLISIVERCHRATFISSAADFVCMVQYLQLVFKVSG